MARIDTFDLLLIIFGVFVYGASFIISIIFTLSMDTYHKIEEKFSSSAFSYSIITPLDAYIERFDFWMEDHNKIVGPFIMFLSLFALKSFFDIAVAF